MGSKARDDLPEPDRPVMTSRASRGISTSMFFRLCSRAPRTTSLLPSILPCMGPTIAPGGGAGRLVQHIVPRLGKSDSLARTQGEQPFFATHLATRKKSDLHRDRKSTRLNSSH